MCVFPECLVTCFNEVSEWHAGQMTSQRTRRIHLIRQLSSEPRDVMSLHLAVSDYYNLC